MAMPRWGEGSRLLIVGPLSYQIPCIIVGASICSRVSRVFRPFYDFVFVSARFCLLQVHAFFSVSEVSRFVSLGKLKETLACVFV